MLEKDNNLMNGKGEWNEGDHPRDSDGKFTSKGGGQSTVSQVKTESQSTKKEPRTLSSQIDSVLAGTYKEHYLTVAQETPKILQDIGVPNKPMLITAKHTYLAINKDGKYSGENDHYHDLGKETLENLPKLLESPILVFQKNKDDIIAVVNAVDKNKNPVIVPIRINGKGQQNFIEIEANIIKSVYGRNNMSKFIEQNVTADNLLLVENKKIRNLKS